MSRSSRNRRDGKNLRTRNSHRLRQAILETLESRTLLTASLPSFVHPSSTFAATISGSDSAPILTVTAGEAGVDQDFATTGASWTLNLSGSSQLAFNSAETIAGLSLSDSAKISINSGGGANGEVLNITSGSLSIISNATLDLGDNDMILAGVGSAGVTQLQSLLAQGFTTSHNWSGTGLTSSAAAATNSATYRMSLGFGLNGTFGSPLSTLDGVTLGSNDCIVKYCLMGDANLDGAVSNADLNKLKQHLGTTDATSWVTGDFDYDGLDSNADLNFLKHDIFENTTGAEFVRTIALSNMTLSMIEGEAVSGTIATFIDSSTAAASLTAASYQATIFWGDDNIYTGTITSAGGTGQYTIAGSTPLPYFNNLDALVLAEVTYVPGVASGRLGAMSEPIAVIPAIQNFTATGISTGEIDLNWTLNEVDANDLELYRSTDPMMGYTFIRHVSTSPTSPATSYQDTDMSLVENKRYYYEIQAFEFGGFLSSFAKTNGTTVADVANLTATADTTSKITLTWDLNVTNANHIQIDRSPDGSTNWTTIATLSGSAITVDDTNLDDSNHYFYRARAQFTGSNSSYSNIADAWTTPIQFVYYTSTTNSITLNWANISDTVTSVELDRSNDNGSTWTQLTNSLLSTDSSYTDSNLSINTGYLYRFKAIEPSGPDIFSQPITAYTLPAAPTLSTSPSITSDSVILNWTNSSGSATQFLIERSADGGATFNPIDTTAPGATSYNDQTVADGMHYYYKVAAATPDLSNSNPSAQIQATTPIFAPSGLTATPGTQGEIDLSWIDNSGTASGFAVYRGTSSSGPFSQIAVVNDPTDTEFIDTGLSNNTSYYYQVKATEDSDSSSPDSTSATTIVAFADTAPANFAVNVASPIQLNLSWSAVQGATGYSIQRQASGAAWQDIAVIGSGSTTSYQDVGLWDNVAYSYRINASSDTATSDFSSAVSATTPKKVPNGPSNLTAVLIGPGTVQLIWQNNAYNEDRFIIQRSIDQTNWTNIGQTSPGNTQYTDGGLAPSKTYYYRVRAENSIATVLQDSSPAATSIATDSRTDAFQPPAAPTNLSVSIIANDGAIAVSFTPGIGGGAVQKYELQRSYSGNTGIIPASGSSSQLIDGHPIYGVNYTYWVIAINAAGRAISSPINGTLPTLVHPFGPVGLYVWQDGSAVTFHADLSPFQADPQEQIQGFKVDVYSGTFDKGDTLPSLPVVPEITAEASNPWKTVTGLPDGNYTEVSYVYHGSAASDTSYQPFSIVHQTFTQPSTFTVVPDGSLLTLTYNGAGVIEYSPDGSNWWPTANYSSYAAAPGVSGYLRGGGGYSAPVAFHGQTLNAPTGLTATATGPGSVHLSWDAIPPLDSTDAAVSGGAIAQDIELQRSDDGGANFFHVAYVDASLTSFDDGGGDSPGIIDSTHTSIYRIRREGVAGFFANIPLVGYSPFSATATATTWALVPTDVNVAARPNELDLDWTDNNEGETETDVVYSTDSNLADNTYTGGVENPLFHTVALGPDVTHLAITGLTPSTSYKIWLKVLPNGDDPIEWVQTSGTTPAWPTIGVSVLLNAAELGPDGQPSDGYFKFTRTGDVTGPFTTSYTVDASAANAATAGTEYNPLSGSVSFGAGQSIVLVPLVPEEINHIEATKTVTVTVPPPNGSGSPATATMNIVNTDDVNITVAAETTETADEESIPVSATNHYGRPYCDILNVSTSDSSILVDDASTVDLATDGSGWINALAEAIGAAFQIAASPSGSTGSGPQNVDGLPLVRFDGNRDGAISFASGTNSDATTDAQPFKFWYNVASTSGNGKPDWQLNTIANKNELENFSRVQVQVPTGFDPLTWSVQAELIPDDLTNNVPVIRLAGVTTQDFLYITDDASANALIGTALSSRIGGAAINPVSVAVSAADVFNGALSFVFEGVIGGEGALEFIFHGPGNSTTTSGKAYLNVVDFKQMRARVTIGDNPGDSITPFVNDQQYAQFNSNSPETNDVVVFVHGWRMKRPEKIQFANEAFRRLYWQGFKGRFYEFDWPTFYVGDSRTDKLLDPNNFNSSENIAWNSAAELRQFLLQLDGQYGYQHVNIFAHSMGNIVASEALRLQAQSGDSPAKIINNYVASQAAVAAEAYDPQVAYSPHLLLAQYANDPLASFLGGAAYFSGINSVANDLINFYNPVDFALGAWRKYNEKVRGTDTTQPVRYMRIDGVWFRAEAQLHVVDFTDPSERYEFFSHEIDPPSYALGAQAEVYGPFDAAHQVNLHNLSGLATPTEKSGAVPVDGVDFTNDPTEHSGEFNETNMQRKYYWNLMMKAFGLPTWDSDETNFPTI